MRDPLVSLVIPIYNGGDRMPVHLQEVADFVRRQPDPYEVIMVDDHSRPDVEERLQEFARENPWVRLIRNDRNRGKGFSVARGMLAARGTFRIFTDADLAYPIEEVRKIKRELEAGYDVAVACRVLEESRYLMSPNFFRYLYTRHLMSRFFNGVVRRVLLPGILDTQAGLKGFTAPVAQEIFARLTIPGFGFDVEVLYIARKHGWKVKQTPVLFRYDSEPSTVNFAQDAFQMLKDLVAIQANDRHGRYG